MKNTYITSHLSEQRIENMLNEYWEKYANRHNDAPFKNTYNEGRILWYFPSCPEIDSDL